MVAIDFWESVGERFMVYAKAHHDGDVNSAMEDLLLCHKVLYAKILREGLHD